MDSAKLAERLRGIIKPPAVPAGTCPPAPAATSTGGRQHEGRASLVDILGGGWRDSGDGRSFVVEHRVDADRRHGRVTVGELAECHRRASRFAPLLSSGAAARPPFVFFDLETTGLNGGAGTLAFLVACGWFDAEGAFVTRQHLLTEFTHERLMLGAMAGDLASAGTLVSFNGKSFDAPLLETRHLFHRVAWMFGAVPHIDVLHPSRNFWGRDHGSRSSHVNTHKHTGAAFGQRQGQTEAGRGSSATARAILERLRPFDRAGASGSSRSLSRHDSAQARPELAPGRGASAAGNSGRSGFSIAEETGGAARSKRECSLAVLEEHVLGVRRAGDVSGYEIPGRYFEFVRSGDARPLIAVLEHNRLDLLSLAGLSARLLGLLADGAGEVRDAYEALALGHLYTRAGIDTPARGAFERAVSMAGSTAVRIEALRSLACAARRAREYEEAARCWRRLLDVPGCPQTAAREASEALAVHHEHRARDLTLAKAFALRSLDAEARPAWNDAVQHRLARIERKLERAELPGLLSY